MPRSVLRVGTRPSAVALAQAEAVRQAVSEVITHRNFELVPVTTAADEHDGPLPPFARKAMMVDALHDALLSGKIDLAVHSAKHLPPVTPEGLTLAGVPTREDPRDALCTRSGSGFASLGIGTTIGTSSPARRAQLLALGRGFDVVALRGHLDLRLRRMTDGEVQALVVSNAGLKRLGKADRAVEVLPINVMLPPAGSGLVAAECRANDRNMRAALAELEDPRARAAFEAERSFLLSFGDDGSLPIAALSEADGVKVRIRGLVAAADGSRVLRDQVEGDDPEKAGIELAERLRAQGADEVLSG